MKLKGKVRVALRSQPAPQDKDERLRLACEILQIRKSAFASAERRRLASAKLDHVSTLTEDNMQAMVAHPSAALTYVIQEIERQTS